MPAPTDATQDFDRVLLGPEALSYMVSSLSQGRTLSRLVAKATDFTRGPLFTLVPPSAALLSTTDFGRGGILKASDSEAAAIAAIRQVLTSARDGVFVAEHPAGHCSDPSVQTKLGKRFCFGEEVYFFAESSTNALGLQQVLRNGRSWLNSTFISRRPSEFESQLGSMEVSLETLTALAQSVVLCGISAWDGEGYIFWESV